MHVFHLIIEITKQSILSLGRRILSLIILFEKYVIVRFRN